MDFARKTSGHIARAAVPANLDFSWPVGGRRSSASMIRDVRAKSENAIRFTD
jgi:hypothetical protein